MRDDLMRKDLKLGKKTRVSRHDAVKMHADGSKDAYDLDCQAREFIHNSKRLMDRELDYYACGRSSLSWTSKALQQGFSRASAGLEQGLSRA